MKVYCEESGETVEIESWAAHQAAESAHGREDKGTGNVAHYRVERRPGEWHRFAVSMTMQPVFTTRCTGTCDPPPSEDDEDAEEMGDE